MGDAVEFEGFQGVVDEAFGVGVEVGVLYISESVCFLIPRRIALLEEEEEEEEQEKKLRARTQGASGIQGTRSR